MDTFESFDICKSLLTKLDDEYRTFSVKFETLKSALQSSEGLYYDRYKSLFNGMLTLTLLYPPLCVSPFLSLISQKQLFFLDLRAEKETQIQDLENAIKALHGQYQESLQIIAQKEETEAEYIEVIKALKGANDELQIRMEQTETQSSRSSIKQRNALAVAQTEIDHLKSALAEIVAKVNEEAFNGIEDANDNINLSAARYGYSGIDLSL
eukprot:g2899.t1